MSHGSENRIIGEFIKSGGDCEPARRLFGSSHHTSDWDYIINVARENKIASLMYQNMNKSGLIENVPTGVRRELARIYHGTGLANWQLWEEMQRVVRELEDRGVQAIALKGAALMVEVLENVAIRHLSDIDLLIRERDLVKAEATVVAMGYIPSEEFRARGWYIQNLHHLVPYRNPKTGAVIELHRNIVPENAPFRVDAGRLWERARRIKKRGLSVLILSPEDLVVHICLHLSFSDRFGDSLKALGDIALCVRHYGNRINWDSILGEAEDGKYAHYLYYPLYLAKDVCNASIPQRTLNELKNRLRISQPEDYVLKLVIKKWGIFRLDSIAVVPGWRFRRLCKELLRVAPPQKKAFSVLISLFGPPTLLAIQHKESSCTKSMYLRYPVLGFYRLMRRLIRRIVHKLLNRVPLERA